MKKFIFAGILSIASMQAAATNSEFVVKHNRCNILSELHYKYAVVRDKGFSQPEAVDEVLNQAKTLNEATVRTALETVERVWVNYSVSTPLEIRDSSYRACMNGNITFHRHIPNK